uniref:Uncharacterized protein n=1 Tax=Timema poppense TaxID=170557 RepID=A0A7R9DPX9_TIMPO|nr:unnamed protein product [Timema poppensis]
MHIQLVSKLKYLLMRQQRLRQLQAPWQQ